jgi:hypothetical protein
VELKTLMTLAVPAVLINLTSVLMMVVSQGLVGHYSTEALAVVVCATMWFNLVWMAAYGFAGALDTLAAQSFGAGSLEGVVLWTKRALLLITIVSIPTGIALCFGEPVLQHLFHQEGEIARLGGVYCAWLILGLFPQQWTVVLQKYLQAQGVLWPIIWQGVAANVFNISIQAILIYPAGLGVTGSAIGMSLARIFQFIHTVVYVVNRHRRLEKEKADAANGVVVANAAAAEEDEDVAPLRPRTPRQVAHAAASLVRQGSVRLVRGVRSGVRVSAGVVVAGARGVVHYGANPSLLVRDFNEQRLRHMEGVWNRAAIKQFVVLGISAGAMTGRHTRTALGKSFSTLRGWMMRCTVFSHLTNFFGLTNFCLPQVLKRGRLMASASWLPRCRASKSSLRIMCCSTSH